MTRDQTKPLNTDPTSRKAELAVGGAAAGLIKKMERLSVNLLRVAQLAGPGDLTKAASGGEANTVARLRMARDAINTANEALEELLPDSGVAKVAPSTAFGASLRLKLARSATLKVNHGERQMKTTDQEPSEGLGALLLNKLQDADLRKRQDAETLRKNAPASAPATTTTAAKAAKP